MIWILDFASCNAGFVAKIGVALSPTMYSRRMYTAGCICIVQKSEPGREWRFGGGSPIFDLLSHTSRSQQNARTHSSWTIDLGSVPELYVSIEHRKF